ARIRAFVRRAVWCRRLAVLGRRRSAAAGGKPAHGLCPAEGMAVVSGLYALLRHTLHGTSASVEPLPSLRSWYCALMEIRSRRRGLHRD
ncbi:unnamed protein product, partial [Ascophyllum nodosum]